MRSRFGNKPCSRRVIESHMQPLGHAALAWSLGQPCGGMNELPQLGRCSLAFPSCSRREQRLDRTRHPSGDRDKRVRRLRIVFCSHERDPVTHSTFTQPASLGLPNSDDHGTLWNMKITDDERKYDNSVRTHRFPFSLPADGFVTKVELSTYDVRKIIHAAYRGINFWTRAPLPLDEMHLDHVWAESRGGPNHLYNIVPTTHDINSSKSGSFDREAVTAVLAIIRLRYGPFVVSGLQRFRTKGPAKVCAAEPSTWWVAKVSRLQGRRLDHLTWLGCASNLELHVERQRFIIAAWLKENGPDWRSLSALLTGSSASNDLCGAVPSVRIVDIVLAWRSVMSAARTRRLV